MTERTEIDAFKSSEDLHLELIKNSPKVVSSFVPSNALDQKNRFLSGDIENTSHRYDRLEQIDFEEKIEKAKTIRSKFHNNPNVELGRVNAYTQFADRDILAWELLKSAKSYNNAVSPEEKKESEAKFMKNNIELYGEPEEVVYRLLINERLRKIEEKDLSPDAEFIKHELFDMISIKPEGEGSNERFSPSQDPTNIEHRRLVYESKTVE